MFVELRVLRFQENPFKVNGELVVTWFCGLLFSIFCWWQLAIGQGFESFMGFLSSFARFSQSALSVGYLPWTTLFSTYGLRRSRCFQVTPSRWFGSVLKGKSEIPLRNHQNANSKHQLGGSRCLEIAGCLEGEEGSAAANTAAPADNDGWSPVSGSGAGRKEGHAWMFKPLRCRLSLWEANPSYFRKGSCILSIEVG